MNEQSLAQVQKDIDNLKNVALVFNKTLASQKERIQALEGGRVKSVSEGEANATGYIQADTSVASHLEEFKTDREQSRAAISFEAVKSSGFSEWIAVDWPMKVGAFLILLVAGWFVLVAGVMVGPVGRVTFGILFGISVLLFGQRRIKKSLDQGGVLLVLGATIIFLTIFAARTVYDFFTPASASAAMFLVVIYLAFMSVLHQNRALSVMSLIAGSIVPILVAGSSNFIALFSYLFVLSLGTFFVAWKTGQRLLLILLLVIIFMYSAPYTFGLASFEKIPAFLFALVFGAFFFGASFLAMIKNGSVDKEDLIVSGLNSASFLMWIYVSVDSELRSFVSLTVAFVLSIVAYAIARSDPRVQSFAYTRFASAFLFLVAATVFEFSGPALTIAFIIEASLLAILSLKVLKGISSTKAASLLFIVPGLLSLENIGNYMSARHVFTEDFFVIALFIGALSFVGWLFRDHVKNDDSLKALHSGFYEKIFLLSSAYTLLFIWMILHAGMSNQTVATFFALTIYTILGMKLYVRGKSMHNSRLSYFGSVLFVIVIARLFLVEVWAMSVGYKIVTFFIIGILLMSTAFMGRGNKDVSPDA